MLCAVREEKSRRVLEHRGGGGGSSWERERQIKRAQQARGGGKGAAVSGLSPDYNLPDTETGKTRAWRGKKGDIFPSVSIEKKKRLRLHIGCGQEEERTVRRSRSKRRSAVFLRSRGRAVIGGGVYAGVFVWEREFATHQWDSTKLNLWSECPPFLLIVKTQTSSFWEPTWGFTSHAEDLEPTEVLLNTMAQVRRVCLSHTYSLSHT